MNLLKKGNDEIFVRDDSCNILKYRTYEQLIFELKNCLLKTKGDVLEAYLFGSYSRGDYTKNSDLDIIIISNTTLEFHKRFKDFEELYKIAENIELRIYTPKEWQKINQMPNPGHFWKNVLKDALRLI